MNDCIFCQIVNNEAPRTAIFENEHVLAFAPLHPVVEGHTLVIPKAHYENIFDVDEKALTEVILATNSLSKILAKQYGATGVNILNASGKDAQQSVFHIHFHIVPRHPDDGLDMWIKQGLV
jgi:histidine triad (HIT) family protein